MSVDVTAQLAAHIVAKAKARDSTLIVGLCGAQGSGKSTMAAALKELLEGQNIATAVLSIDDLYLPRNERIALSERVHPLLRTRGVPGTHDVSLGLEILRSLATPGQVAIPSFDKARDDRRHDTQWPRVQAPVNVAILEGWCVGAMPQEEPELRVPINELEREHDPDGTWRRFVNDALARDYQRLFEQLDLLILLKAPDFDIVYAWRLEQEHTLGEQVRLAGGDLSRVMSDEEVRRFISHYERLTRHILNEMPSRADIVVHLDRARGPRLHQDATVLSKQGG